MSIWLIVGLLLTAGVLWGAVAVQRRGVYLAQYIFFLRYPILFGLLLVIGPWLSITAGKTLLGNLFVLDCVGVAIASAMGWFLASTIVYTFNLIFSLSCARTGLPFFKYAANGRQAAIARQETMAKFLADRHVVWSVALLVPMLVVLLVRAPASSKLPAFASIVGGIAAAAVVSWAWSAQLSEQLGKVAAMVSDAFGAKPIAARSLPPFVKWFATTFSDGYASGHDGVRWHARAALFMVTTFVIYGMGLILLRDSFASQSRRLADAVPVVAYILLLLMVAAWLLAWLSFYLDKFRIPPLPVVLAFWMLVSLGRADDSYFRLSQPTQAAAPRGSESPLTCGLLPTKAVEAWAARHHAQGGGKPTIVVVAASGGGIAASLWTARVLTALASPDEGIGPAFANAITLISSASGGGLGAAYFVDAYDERHGAEFDRATLQRIVDGAGASSLQETAFALAYNGDRGAALERSWERWLSRPGPTLGNWRAGVREGWRPTQIFNVTVAETGQRLLLGPVDCPTNACFKSGVPWRGQSLHDLYGPGCDIPVVTAARLSATFPWVTPLSRAPEGRKEYHLGDGGYYDNFGVVTAIEWLSNVHAERGLDKLADKILLVQIRASEDVRKEPAEGRGWYYETLGPLVTLLNVRTTSQRNHNDAELLGLKAALGQQNVKLETVEFELATSSPLSWHLTEAEKALIVSQWTQNPVIQAKRRKLACLWKEAPENWAQICETHPPINLQSPQGPAQLFQQAQSAAEHAVAAVVPANAAIDSPLPGAAVPPLPPLPPSPSPPVRRRLAPFW